MKSSESCSGMPLREPSRRPARKEEDGSVEKVRFIWDSNLFLILRRIFLKDQVEDEESREIFG